MNKFILKQLNKIKQVDLPQYDESTTVLFIPKSSTTLNNIIVGNVYKVQLEDYILHPYDGFTLHENWNNNILPTDNIMNVEITESLGKMIKINGIGVHDNKVWAGWLPKSSMKIIERL